LRESKITKFERCMKLINEMSLHQKFQCRLDHDTTLTLKSQGYGLNRIRGWRGRIVKSGITELLKISLHWAEFFIETPLNVWDDLGDEIRYEDWLESAVCQSGPLKRPKWHLWVYGGGKNPITEMKYKPIDWFEKLKQEIRLEVAEEMKSRRANLGLRPVVLGKNLYCETTT